MNTPIRVKIIKYFLVLIITLIIGAPISIIGRGILGNIFDAYEDSKIINLITGFLITVFFFILYSWNCIIPRKNDKTSFELSASKNDFDIKDFLKNYIKTNAITDILIYAVLALPIMIAYMLVDSVSPALAIISANVIFFYALIDIPIISYLVSVLFFCIGYVLCLVLTYHRLFKRVNS